jgi:hypothetical protein
MGGGGGDETDGGRLGDCSELCRAPRHTESGGQLADSPVATLSSVDSTPANFSHVAIWGDTHTHTPQRVLSYRVSHRQLKLSATNVLLCLTCIRGNYRELPYSSVYRTAAQTRKVLRPVTSTAREMVREFEVVTACNSRSTPDFDLSKLNPLCCKDHQTMFPNYAIQR